VKLDTITYCNSVWTCYCIDVGRKKKEEADMDSNLKIENTENLLKITSIDGRGKESSYIVLVGKGFFQYFKEMSEEIQASKEDEKQAYALLFELIQNLNMENRNIANLKNSILYQMTDAGRQKQKHIMLLSLWSYWFDKVYSVSEAKETIKIAYELSSFFEE
jgi:hypothetical protein